MKTEFYVTAKYKTSEEVPWGSLDDDLRAAGGDSDGSGTDMATGERDIGFAFDSLEQAAAAVVRLREVHPAVKASYVVYEREEDE